MLASQLIKPRYIMIGGFLGAGKTTCMLKAAGYFSERGKRVGLIANDQSHGLVDTNMFNSHGFPTEEIAGGCFCCRFQSLVQASEKLALDQHPDIYLAEPVGSCTDLVATVVFPLRQMYGEQYSIAPLSVLVDPVRAQRFLGLKTGKSFSPKVNYIYGKQLEEADLIVINKREMLDEASLQQLVDALRTKYPASQVLAVSARTGEGLAEWFALLESASAVSRSTMEVDYETYAEGEALLGWLNLAVQVQGPEFDGNSFLKELLEQIHSELVEREFAIAHLKATLTPDVGNDLGVANLVREDGSVESAYQLLEPLEGGELVVNLRAEADPEVLESVTRMCLRKACEQ